MPSISLSQLLHTVADAGAEFFRRPSAKRATPEMLNSWCNELLSVAGEASGISLARQIVNGYGELSNQDRQQFFQALNTDFDVDADLILSLAKEYQAKQDGGSYGRLFAAVESRRQEVFRRINFAPDGISTLVGMRRDLRQFRRTNTDLAPVENDLKHLLTSWFNKGFLTLRRLDWNTPAAILEKLIQNESVHEITGWQDLRQRLAADRMCFAFFHGAMPDEPIIFVEVALVDGMTESIHTVIDPDRQVLDPDNADTAIFYSINTCHEGLYGIPFGSFLIKQVVLEIMNDYPRVRRFATLSPVPRFRRWLLGAIDDRGSSIATESERETLRSLEEPEWYKDKDTEQRLQPILIRLAANYFLNAKSGNEPYDPVARFHLRNGARLERINWLGDLSANGLRQSFGILVNYVYDLDEIVKNHEEYVVHHKINAASAITKLLRKQASN